MNQKERDVLRIEESFKDILENDLEKKQTSNKEVKVKDIKFIGQVTGQDNNIKSISESVFLVNVEIKEINKEGKERKTEQEMCYLGNELIGGTIGNLPMVFDTKVATNEPDKIRAVNNLLEKTSQQEIENNSMNNLQRKELSEVLTAHFGREVSEDEVEKMIEEMDKSEIKKLEEEKQKDKDENDLSKKQTEKIKVSGVQKVDLDQLVDGMETLGKRLDLQQYDSLYVVYSDKVDEITSGTDRNNTTYSLVGMTKDGEARVLNDEFEIDRSVGNSANRESTKIRADNTATIDNKDSSVYTRKSNGMSIGCENNQVNVNMFLYQKTLEENENVGIQIETSKTSKISIETREIMKRNNGNNQMDKVQDEIEERTEHGCEPVDVENMEMHQHFSKEEINRIVIDIHQYGEINRVFGIKEVRDKLLKELEENKDKLSTEQIIENVKREMDQDAENLERAHKK